MCILSKINQKPKSICLSAARDTDTGKVVMDEWNSWDEFVSSLDDLDDDCDPSLHYQDVEQSGFPVRPLEFPTPTVSDCELRTVPALDHRTGQSRLIENVLVRKRREPKTPFDRAYLIRKKICKTTYGSVRLAVVLNTRDYSDEGPDVEEVPWKSTDELVAIKISCWSKLRQLRAQSLEDPIREVAALQLVGNYHPHVLGCNEVLQDDKCLYAVMPYYSNGANLHGRLFADDTDKKREHSLPPPNEDEARDIFRQLLLGLFHLQRKGIFHRDISLDNLLIDKQNVLKIIDLGSSLRVPYNDPCNADIVTDVSEGTMRRRMQIQQGKGRKLMYLAPELLAEKPFDGFACDLYSAGICLFILLIGLAPFKCAQASEKRYAKISKGCLDSLLRSLNIEISPAACDLLQNMLWHDPKNRLSLMEVMRHPWLMGEKLTEAQQEQAINNVSCAESVNSTSSKSSTASTQNSKTGSSQSTDLSKGSSSSSKADSKTEARQSASETRGSPSKGKVHFLNLPKNIQNVHPTITNRFASTPIEANGDKREATITAVVGNKETISSARSGPEAQNVASARTNDKLSPHRRAAAISGKQILNRFKKAATIPTKDMN